jgi:hypothetical protein
MQPTNISPEAQPVALPQAKELSPLDADRVYSPTPEKLGGSIETSSSSPAQGQPTTLPQPVDPQITSTQVAKPVTAATSVPDDNPAVADDVDLIEKSWVDKAKRIINDYKHDPYQQEKEVGKLQADYIKKRYGKSIKTE